MLRIPTPLSEETEDLVHRIIGCCIQVHRELGPGLLERVYCRAAAIELEAAGIPCDCERGYDIWYRERLLSRHFVDLVVADQVLLEVKAIDRLAPVHHAQVMSYLKASGLRVGLLLNFNTPILAEGVKRIIL